MNDQRRDRAAHADPYVYPGTTVLKNRFGIKDGDALDVVERRFAVQCARGGVPRGRFDLKHLCAIHQHLFQDVYEWAEKTRTVEISTGKSQFQFRQNIETGMADVHRRLQQADFLANLAPAAFAAKAAEIMGDLNYVHPVREGNGRTQMQYLVQLAEEAGHRFDPGGLLREAWMRASQDAHLGRYEAMAACIAAALAAPVSRGRRRRSRGSPLP
jgi:cell filamentation protein